jgi:hypothetical protein
MGRVWIVHVDARERHSQAPSVSPGIVWWTPEWNWVVGRGFQSSQKLWGLVGAVSMDSTG